MTRLDRIAIASRAFGLAAVLGLGLVSGDRLAIQGTLILAAISASATAAHLWGRLPSAGVVCIEALLVGLICGFVLPGTFVLLPYLVVPALIAGLGRGVIPLIIVIAGEIGAVATLGLFANRLLGNRAALEGVAPWFMTALGVGLLGAWLREIGKVVPSAPSDASYESARRLVTQLRTVARRLSAGLDPISMGTQLLSMASEELEASYAALFVRTEGGKLVPLCYHGDQARVELLPEDPAVAACWPEMEPVQQDATTSEGRKVCRVALPLRVGSRMIGVVLSDKASISGGVPARLMSAVDEYALRLDTALAFDEVRSIATAEERQRLAREIHDGVAQEVASLGYVVDDLFAESTDDEQRRKLKSLRSELSRVVSELRLSIFDLRSDVSGSGGLGAALSDYVRQIGSRSQLTVHLTLDEAPVRLRSEVETELLRIAQEAITNARKHSGADNLWVDCRVHPPAAQIEVRDDGKGLSAGRDDSFGLRIMRERAKRIGAELAVDNGSATGTVVRVTLGANASFTGVLQPER